MKYVIASDIHGSAYYCKKLVEAFEKASFEMNVGDVRLVKTEYGYHIIEKLEKTDTDLYGTKTEDGKRFLELRLEKIGGEKPKKDNPDLPYPLI